MRVVPRKCLLPSSRRHGGALGTARFRDASLGVRRLDEVQADTGAPRAGLGRRLRTFVEVNVRDRRTYQDQGEHDSAPRTCSQELQHLIRNGIVAQEY